MCKPTMKKYHTSEYERNKIIEMKHNGMSYEEIADTMESCWSSLDKKARIRKIKDIIEGKNKNHIWTDEENEMLIYYCQKGWTSACRLQASFPTKTYYQIRNRINQLKKKGIIRYHCADNQRDANKLAVIEGKDEAKTKDSFINYRDELDENFFGTFEISSSDDVK